MKTYRKLQKRMSKDLGYIACNTKSSADYLQTILRSNDISFMEAMLVIQVVLQIILMISLWIIISKIS